MEKGAEMNLENMRVMTIFGTRPEIIRLSCILPKLDLAYDHRTVFTGQNRSRHLSAVFFDDLEIRKPDRNLTISSNSLGTFLGKLFVELEKEFKKFQPHAVLFLGDTNSSLACLIAKRLKIPIYHLEAGNRSFDQNVPEEINRKVIDHTSDFNLSYTENARNNLIREGMHPRNTAVVGSPLNEVLNKFSDQIEQSQILKSLSLLPKQYFLVSLHRQENIDDFSRLQLLVESLNCVYQCYRQPIIVSAHPRLISKLRQSSLKLTSGALLHTPFPFFDYIKLQLNSRVVLSDSGSISEESAILGFPAVTLRDSMERPEALESGNIVLSGIQPRGVLHSINLVESFGLSKQSPIEYQIPDTSIRTINFMASTLPQYNFWTGVRK